MANFSGALEWDVIRVPVAEDLMFAHLMGIAAHLATCPLLLLTMTFCRVSVKFILFIISWKLY